MPEDASTSSLAFARGPTTTREAILFPGAFDREQQLRDELELFGLDDGDPCYVGLDEDD